MDSHVVWGDVEKVGEDSSSSATCGWAARAGSANGADITFKADKSSSGSFSAADSSQPRRRGTVDRKHDSVASLISSLGGPGLEGSVLEDSHESTSSASNCTEQGQQQDTSAAQALVEQALSKHGLWSVGTSMHGVGRCRACVYFHSRNGCKVGAQCVFCHIPHTSKSSKSLNLWRRVMCKRIGQVLVEELGGDLDAFRSAAELVGAKSSHMRHLLDAHLTTALNLSEADRPGDVALPPQRRNIQSL